jgi:VIT1/CCC1 family predicted Fe2+/Mn2+ transporter
MRIDATEKQGLSFGVTSGVITTLGVIIGLYATTQSATVVLSGIVVTAIADSLSDATGMHLAEESTNEPPRRVWEATLSTFAAKILSGLSFVIPVLILPLLTAVIVDVIYGMMLVAILSRLIAKQQKLHASNVITNHLLLILVVIIITYFIGEII